MLSNHFLKVENATDQGTKCIKVESTVKVENTIKVEKRLIKVKYVM